MPRFVVWLTPVNPLGEVASLEKRAVGVHDRDGASAAGWSLCSWKSLNALRPLGAGRSLRACRSLRSGEPAGACVAAQLRAD
jgi:hypothetical protein